MKTLKSLVVTDRAATGAALLRGMAANIEDYGLDVATIGFDAVADVKEKPHLVFIDRGRNVTPEDILAVSQVFGKTPCIVLSDSGDAGERRAFLRAGADEVMRIEDLYSPIGKHLLEKLLAYKELAEAQNRIAQSEERFRDVIEHANEIILLVEEDATVVYVSPAFGRQTGYEEWEVLGSPLFDLVAEAERAGLSSLLPRIAEASAEVAHGLECTLKIKDGSLRQFAATATNLLRTETVQAIVINMRDVTAQRQAEEQLEQYRHHLETLVERRTRELVEVQTRANTVIDASPDALLAMDNEGVILFISQHYRQAYPKSAPFLVPGRKITDVFDRVVEEIGFGPGDPRYREMMDWWRAPRGVKEFALANGTWLQLRAKRMQDNRGTVVATTNITDLKRQQALLAEKSAALEIALETERGIVEQQKTFVSMVSHEFRTPLTIIDGNAQIIEGRAETLGPEKIRKRAGMIRSAVERLVRLIDSTLSAHALDTGRMQLMPEPCNLPALVRAIVAEQQDISTSHSVVMEIADDIPERLLLDPALVRQLLTNLLSNAVKYSPGGARVDLRLGRDAACGDVFLQVQDYGVGIPERELHKISEKYFRASTSSGIPGTGLGLHLVRQFVDMHKGRFRIDSVEGEGTTVTVWLPAVQAEAGFTSSS